MNKIFEILNLADKQLHNLFKDIIANVTYTTPSGLISNCWAEYEKRAENTVLIGYDSTKITPQKITQILSSINDKQFTLKL